jgi:hypothetical protein
LDKSDDDDGEASRRRVAGVKKAHDDVKVAWLGRANNDNQRLTYSPIK